MISTFDKIGKNLIISEPQDLCLSLLKAFYEDSENLVIRNFSEIRQKYIDNFCSGNPFDLHIALEEMARQNIAHYDALTNNLVLYGLNSSSIRAMSLSPNSFKRKYKINNISLNCALLVKPYKKGFRVPSSIFPFLTGAPLPEEYRNTLLKSNNPELIYIEELRRSLPKEVMRVYCSFISIADKDGFVECDSCHTVYLSFIKEFGAKSFNHQSWYNSVRKLVSLELLSITPTGYKVSNISCKSGERYVIVPMIVFEKEFKRLETASIRLFFEIIFSLNNGETYKNNKIVNIKADKAFFIKFSGSGTEGAEAREKIMRTMIQCRKRYVGELIRSLLGEDSAVALRKYFNFKVLHGCVFMVQIKSEYYISKEIDYKKDLDPLKANCHKRLQLLKEFFSDIDYIINEKDLILLWRVLRDKSIYKFKKILAAIKKKSKFDKLNISALPLYIAAL